MHFMVVFELLEKVEVFNNIIIMKVLYSVNVLDKP